MKKEIHSDRFMIELTRKVIHLFLNKQIDAFLHYLDTDFVWIGDYKALYTRGKEQFAATITEESKMPPVTLSQEEYSALVHAKDVWVTFGRCTATAKQEEPSEETLSSTFHFNFVWRDGEQPLLLEAMACHAAEPVQLPGEEVTAQAKVFKETLRFKKAMKNAPDSRKLSVREVKKAGYSYIYPSEILYIRSDDKYSVIHTADRTLTTCTPLSEFDLPEFIRVQRSYLVNRMYVCKMQHYKALLTDGTEVPVSRKLYGELKKAFEEK